VKEMETPKIPVKCKVENCHYNKKQACYANSLEVNTMGDNKAETSDGTCCSTFKNHETM
jgi:hypothetical protein